MSNKQASAIPKEKTESNPIISLLIKITLYLMIISFLIIGELQSIKYFTNFALFFTWFSSLIKCLYLFEKDKKQVTKTFKTLEIVSSILITFILIFIGMWFTVVIHILGSIIYSFHLTTKKKVNNNAA